MINQQDCFLSNPKVVYTRLDETEAVLLHLDTRYYYSLNETGMLIWEHLEQHHSVGETATALSERYAIDEEQALEVVTDFIADLKQDDLIQAVSVE